MQISQRRIGNVIHRAGLERITEGSQVQYSELIQAVTEGDGLRAEALTRQAFDQGSDPEEILNDGLSVAMEIVGQQFSNGEFYVPDLLAAARAMKLCLGILQPFLGTGSHKARGTVVIGTVKGDVHDVGKDIVGIMLKAAGFEVHDLGVNVGPEVFVEAVREFRPDIVGMSALLTTTMVAMKDVIDALQAGGVRDTVKVLVGGAPVTDDFARKIGADGYAPDAGKASELARQLVATTSLDLEG